MSPRSVLRLPVTRVIVVLAIVCTCAFPLVASEQAATRIGEVRVVDQPQGTGIVVALDGDESAPHISRLANPDRIILDFFGAVPKVGYQRINVNNSLVATIRVALFRDGRRGNTPVTRVVVDVEKQVEYESRTEKGKFILRVFEQGQPTDPAAVTEPTMPRFPQTPAVSTDLASNSAQKIALNKVEVSHTAVMTSVVLTFDGPATPQCMTLKDPARFVMDFPDATPGNTLKHSSLSAGVVKSVRVSLFKKQPEVLRVVLDERQEVGRPALVAQGNQVIVQYPEESHTPNARATTTAGSSTSQTRMAASSIVPRLKVESNDRPSPVQPKPSNPVSQAPVLPQATTVIYANGLLSIDAQNSTLTDILYAVSEKTGAKIDLPFSDGMLDKVVFKAGPGSPRDVLATMLQGTAYNYYIIENSSGGLDAIVLSPK
jgi:hypothetical protein